MGFLKAFGKRSRLISAFLSLGINKRLGFITRIIEDPKSFPPSLSQVYLGSGEDGPKKMDKPELERFGELPSGLETLCEDEEGKINFGEEAAKKYRGEKKQKNPFFYPN